MLESHATAHKQSKPLLVTHGHGHDDEHGWLQFRTRYDLIAQRKDSIHYTTRGVLYDKRVKGSSQTKPSKMKEQEEGGMYNENLRPRSLDRHEGRTSTYAAPIPIVAPSQVAISTVSLSSAKNKVLQARLASNENQRILRTTTKSIREKDHLTLWNGGVDLRPALRPRKVLGGPLVELTKGITSAKRCFYSRRGAYPLLKGHDLALRKRRNMLRPNPHAFVLSAFLIFFFFCRESREYTAKQRQTRRNFALIRPENSTSRVQPKPKSSVDIAGTGPCWTALCPMLPLFASPPSSLTTQPQSCTFDFNDNGVR